MEKTQEEMEDWMKELRNKVFCSDGGKINNKGICIIIAAYEELRAEQENKQ